MNVNVGGLVRRERERHGLSLRELARRVGVSASMLSQVETGRTLPSVNTIYAIASELGVSIDALVSEDLVSDDLVTEGLVAERLVSERLVSEGAVSQGSGAAENAALGSGPLRDELAAAPHAVPATHLVRPEERRKLELESGVTWELLSDLLPHLVDFMLVTYEPGGRSSSSGKLTRHAGTEFAFMLRGSLKIQVGFDTYVLRPGDSMAFDSSEPHLLMNEGTEPAVGIWFVLGRRQGAEPRGPRAARDEGATAARYPGPLV